MTEFLKSYGGGLVAKPCSTLVFPAVTVVTKDGEMLANAVGAGQVKEVLANWKQYAGVK